ncbi:MAG: type IV pilus assembly protein PilM [Candidatus Pacebacteria bacterium]|nr:type IV pilus assembly protein PilM [Candidatus Paceibacterota bacterium]
MFNFLQIFLPQRFLGIDVGTSFLKIAEVSRFGNRRKLENYGFLSAQVLYEKPFRTFDKNTLLLSSDDVSRAIRAIMEEAKIKTNQVVFSIPDFSTFFTNFELPQMTKEELPEAVRYEAKQHIPFPLSEMTLDWKLVHDKAVLQKGENLKILLAAVPNEVINQYNSIAEKANLKLYALEAEVFSLIRSLVSEDEKLPLAIIDIGAQSTTCSIIVKRSLYGSHSFNMSGSNLIAAVSKGLSIDYNKAQELVIKFGISSGEIQNENNPREILLPLIDVILSETDSVLNNFRKEKNLPAEGISKVIIAGGMALIPGLKEYFAEHLKAETVIANPFTHLFYPPILENNLQEKGPSFSIAVGAALRGLEY